MKRASAAFSACLLSLLPLACLAIPIEIDLTTFTQATSGTGAISVAADGSSANLSAWGHYEELWYPPPPQIIFEQGVAKLYHDSVPIPLDALTIQFDYDVAISELTATAEFWAVLYDAGGPIPDYKLLLEAEPGASGTETWTLSGASFLGGTVGVEFLVRAGYLMTTVYQDASVDALISNVILNTSEQPPEPPPTEPVPEASTLMLFGSGLSGLAFYVRKRRLTRL